MRAENNYFKINRSLLQSDLWLSEPFTRGQAWVDLFGLALHTDGYMRIRGIKITIKRGQLAYSKRTLSKRWGWSQEKTDRFLNELENDGKIDTQKNNLTTIISILKYDFWQGDKEKTEHRTSHRSRTEPVTLIYNKKDNKDKKDNNNININNILERVDRGMGEDSEASSPKILDNQIFFEELLGMFPDHDVEIEILKMKDWLLSKGRTMNNYKAFARNWLRKAEPKPKVEDVIRL